MSAVSVRRLITLIMTNTGLGLLSIIDTTDFMDGRGFLMLFYPRASIESVVSSNVWKIDTRYCTSVKNKEYHLVFRAPL